MFSDIELTRLRRAVATNSLVLFLGAGFSRGAKNRLGAPIADSKELVAVLWQFAGLEGEPRESSKLGDVFQSALRSGKGHAALAKLLEERLLAIEYPDWYSALPKVFWRRIFTSNVDNLVQLLYERSAEAPRLDVVVPPRDNYRDRDAFLGSVQLVKLHGSLPGSPESLTFTPRQYARRAAERFDPWYFHLINDYASYPTVFVGTQLDEPLFIEYVEARDKRRAGEGDKRPRGWLVVPEVPPEKRAIIDDLGLIHVPGDAEAFLRYLEAKVGFPTRGQVLENTQPAYYSAISAKKRQLSAGQRSSLENFFASFEPVGIPTPAPNHRKLFFLGQSPTWQDLAHDFDAPRAITEEIRAAVTDAVTPRRPLSLLAITGGAGSGKSTIAKRLAIRLVQDGLAVYFSDAQVLPNAALMATALQALEKRAILLIDAADASLRQLRPLLDAASVIPLPPVFIVTARGNAFSRFRHLLADRSPSREFRIPNLSDDEIDPLLAVLERNNALGTLKGLSQGQRRRAILERAWKQLLVAMREATKGAAFDEIIRGEYKELDPSEVRHMYLCAALATEAGFRITRGELLSSSLMSQTATLEALTTKLRDVVIPYGTAGETYGARHPLIAEYVIRDSAPREELKVAYSGILATLARELPSRDRTGNRTFRLYRHLINHTSIFQRFTRDIDQARTIYNDLEPFASSDYHFWLQYGSLELEYGELDLASLYLNQANSLRPDDHYVLCALGHLDYRRSLHARSFEQAVALRERAEETLQAQILERGRGDSYPYHILGSQRLGWLHRWCIDKAKLKAELEETLSLVSEGSKLHPMNDELKELRADIEKEYLRVAVKTEA